MELSKAKKTSPKFSLGFTLVEVILVAAITVIMGTIGTTSYLGVREKQFLDGFAQRIIADLRMVSGRSVAGQDDKTWGIRFVNGTLDYYEIWSGPSYASGQVVSRINITSGVNLADPDTGHYKDILFARGTGIPTITIDGSPSVSAVVAIYNSISTVAINIDLATGLVSFVSGAPVVAAINPSVVENGGSVSLSSITGAGFKSGITVKISKTGQPDRAISGFTISDNSLSGGSFDATGAYAGTWDVVVDDPADSLPPGVGVGILTILNQAILATMYWKNGDGLWSDAANHWSNSNGVFSSSPPTSSEDVFIDNSSGSSQVISIAAAAYAKNINIGSSVNPALNIGNAVLSVGQ